MEAASADRGRGRRTATAGVTSARPRFGGALRRNDRDRDGGDGSRENFKTTKRPGREAVAPRATFAKDAIKDPAAYGAFRRVRRTTKTPTYFIADAEAKAPRSELEALYGTDDWGAKDMRPKMKKMDVRMALVTLTTDFGRPIRPMLPSAGISSGVCANRTCEDYLHFAETVAVLILG
eukprot:jgi/Tetstr1/446984/TSEL_034442.t1